ncbi:BLUF domain-containing protein [Rathayibacter sp. VKM Ac-2927]|uniref:BLUF domain-containing protein n=1 Tax=Rathayibacter sp. VKM Ac-2927 TaxID=2929478 RepID=UPI001FB23EF4|nr:BLUF domain-containing protein [Rathayibacter sp. VKM Ac-2927]MCJ1688466.1 BLUF domain-containing protein [Rathayibacter sp. VKM Ac-2927]
MKQIHYASASFQVGDTVADALLSYAKDLAVWGRTDSVVFPVLTENGDSTTVSLLLTPSSQLFMTDTTGSEEAPEEDAVVADMHRRRDWLHATPVVGEDIRGGDDLVWLEFPDADTLPSLETAPSAASAARTALAANSPAAGPLDTSDDRPLSMENGMVFTVVYVSTLLDTLTDAEVRELLETSRAHNTDYAVSGMLVFRGRNVMQLLEGDETTVRALYERISADPRHEHVVTVWTSIHEQRRFPDWSMGFDELDTPYDASTTTSSWPEPNLTALPAATPAEHPSNGPDNYLGRRAQALRRALVSGDRFVASLAIILHGHRPENVLNTDTDTIIRRRCAECRPSAAPEIDSYPCSTAKNAIWALEAI